MPFNIHRNERIPWSHRVRCNRRTQQVSVSCQSQDSAEARTHLWIMREVFLELMELYQGYEVTMSAEDNELEPGVNSN